MNTMAMWLGWAVLGVAAIAGAAALLLVISNFAFDRMRDAWKASGDWSKVLYYFRNRESILGKTEELKRARDLCAERYTEIANLKADFVIANVTHNDERQRLLDMLERAWGIIANGGGWSDDAVTEWAAAARKWRDDWHALLPGAAPMPYGEPPKFCAECYGDGWKLFYRGLERCGKCNFDGRKPRPAKWSGPEFEREYFRAAEPRGKA